MSLRKTILIAAVLAGFAAAPAARAEVMPVVAGGALGGLVGSLYANGVAATAAGVGAAANAVLAVAPATVAAVGGVIAAASAPVLLGVIVGGTAGYLWMNQPN